MVNKVTLIGNLGRDPDVRTLENGSKVGTFSLATTESYKDKNDTWQNQTEWHNIVVWRYLAEKCERDLKKGSMVYIEGKITHRKYTDKDNIERSTSEIVASVVNSLERREKSQAIGNDAPFPSLDSAPVHTTGNSEINKPQSSQDSFKDLDDKQDDLPF